MGLIKCRECGQKVSSKAHACPNCGGPIKKPGQTSASSGCLSKFVSAAVLIGAVAWFINSCEERSMQVRKAEEQRRAALTPEQRAEEDRQKAEVAAKAQAMEQEEARQRAEEAAIARAKEQEEALLFSRQVDATTVSQQYVLKFLKHPDDATFGFWSVPDMSWNKEQDAFYLSSKVKAKNDFGAELTYRWATIVMLEGNTWNLVSCAIGDKIVYESKELSAKLKGRNEAKTISARPASQRRRSQVASSTFTHKQTGEVLKGTLLGTVSVGSRHDYVVKLGNGQQRCLPISDWDVRK